jgi:hypothetical protein
MKWFEDDSHQIPDYIKNMPPEEVERIATEYEEQFFKESALRRKNQKASA